MQSYRSLRDGKAFDDPTVVEIARKHGVTPAQVRAHPRNTTGEPQKCREPPPCLGRIGLGDGLPSANFLGNFLGGSAAVRRRCSAGGACSTGSFTSRSRRNAIGWRRRDRAEIESRLGGAIASLLVLRRARQCNLGVISASSAGEHESL